MTTDIITCAQAAEARAAKAKKSLNSLAYKAPEQFTAEMQAEMERVLFAREWTPSVTTLARMVVRMAEALEEIRREQGWVCPDFELCEHASCASSYAAWALADKVLTDLTAELKKETTNVDDR